MNTDRIRALAARLRQPDVQGHFDMGMWMGSDNISDDDDRPIGNLIHECGTVACIAGWAAILAQPNTPYADAHVSSIAADYLGLTWETSKHLFVPMGGVDYYKVTPSIAADVLVNLANTGEITWPKEALVDAY